MTARHSQQTQVLGIHSGYTWVWADAAARAAQSDVTQTQVDTACTGIQLDDNSTWRATDTAPTWEQVGAGPGSGANTHTEEFASDDVIETVVEITRETSGTPQDGIGASLDFVVQTGTGNQKIGGVAFVARSESSPEGALVISTTQAGNDSPIISAGPHSASGPTRDEVAMNIGFGSYALFQMDDVGQIPTGDGTAMVGGSGHSGAGNNSFVAAGENNQVESDATLVSGSEAVSRFNSSRVHAGEGFGGPGDAQVHEVIMKAITTDNVPTAMGWDGGGNIFFADDTTFVVNLELIARCTTTPGLNSYFKAWVRGHVTAGTLTIDDSAKVVESEDSAVTDVNFSASANELLIEVEGFPTDTVLWLGWATVLEVIG